MKKDATIKARIRKLISKTEEILQLVETPGMSCLGGANTAFKLYEAHIMREREGEREREREREVYFPSDGALTKHSQS